MFKTILVLTFLASSASAQVWIVDKNAIKKRKEESLQHRVTGKAVNQTKEKGAMLRLYVRNCGFITIPKNSKGDVPKENQTITAVLKERCTIDDWE